MADMGILPFYQKKAISAAKDRISQEKKEKKNRQRTDG
jgi:hypothetical protein